ncbi:MAG: DUF6132 family protein [Cyclobacteriaceae bacterium]
MKHRLIYLVCTVVGLAAGFLYWQQIGCVTGTCPITSSPLNSTLYGGLMGFVASGLFIKENRKEKDQAE